MAITNWGTAKENWEVQNFCGLQKVEFNNEEGSFSIAIHT
jgi:hypothetical protein